MSFGHSNFFYHCSFNSKTMFCQIQHLSYPAGNSVNNFIDPELATVQYTSFDRVLLNVSQLGAGAELARMGYSFSLQIINIAP